MVELTGKGLTRLEKIQDYFPPKGQAYSLKMRQKYLLQEVYKDPNFSIDPSSILRNDWNKLVDQGLIVEASTEEVCVIDEVVGSPHMMELD